MSSIYKTLALVFIGILLAAFIIFRWVRKSKEFTPIEPSSIFKSIEYVEELRLTTYFFEELLILGTPEHVKQIRDELLIEVNNLRDEERKRQFLFDQATVALKQIENKIFASNPSLAKAEQKLTTVKAVYDIINKREGKLIKALTKNNDLFGPAVQRAFRSYQDAQTKLDNWTRRSNVPKAQLKNTADLFKDLLAKAIDDETKIRWNTWQKQKAAVKKLKDQQKDDQKELKGKRKDAENKLQKAKKSLKHTKDKLTSKEAALAQAEDNLAWAIQNQGDTIKPKLMIIAESQISGYVNLKDLKINKSPFSDTLMVYIPEVQLDSVLIKIEDDSTKLYKLANAGREDVSDKGAYYDIFQQLKNAIILAEGRVKERALAAGIKTETRQLAKDYVEQFASNLNLSVAFIDSIATFNPIPRPKLPPPPFVQVEDSLSHQALDTLETLDSATLESHKRRLKEADSLFNSIQQPE